MMGFFFKKILKPFLDFSWLIFLALGGCSNVKEEIYIHKNLENKVFFQALGTSPTNLNLTINLGQNSIKPIWFNDRFMISGLDLAKPKYLVMVRYSPRSSLGKELRTMADQETSSSLWLQYEPEDEPTGYALLALENDGELSGLAARAHRDAFPACGALELLPTDLTFAEQKPTGPVYSELLKIPEVESLFGATSQEEVKGTIAYLEDLGTRFHGSTQGQLVSQKVANLWETSSSGLSSLKIELPSSNQSGQKSVVATIPGQTDDGQTVILGAHLDSINGAVFGEPAPGADDDASGIATLREILRVIASKNLKFKRRIEFHAYGAEEVGLLGSSAIAQNYAKSGRKVVGMMQFDMNAWSQSPGQKVYLIKNDTHDSLRKGVMDLMHTYFQSDFEEATLTAGTSDHKSWTLAGYPSVFPFENPQAYNKALHTNRDTTQTINNLQLTERMVQLGLAFVAHYGGLVAAENSAEDRAKEILETLSKDLKIAVAPASAANTYDVSVSAPSDVKSVEICLGDQKPAVECSGERLVLAQSQEKASRIFYGTLTPLGLSAGKRLSLYGRSGQGKTTHLRTIRLDPKTP